MPDSQPPPLDLPAILGRNFAIEQDVRTLAAEVERLGAENERLRVALGQAMPILNNLQVVSRTIDAARPSPEGETTP